MPGYSASLMDANNIGSDIISTNSFSNLVCHDLPCPLGASVVSFMITIILSDQY